MNEPGQIAALVIQLLCDREKRRRLGAAGYHLAARWHTWAGAAEHVSALLDAARGAAPQRHVEQAHRVGEPGGRSFGAVAVPVPVR